MTAGNPGTPLADKLGLRRGMRCWFHNMPDRVRAAIDPDRAEVDEQPTASDGLQCAHLFVTERDRLEREIAALRPLMAQNGFIWISWPAQGVDDATDLTEEAIRSVALPSGLVDVEVCAVDPAWSALKLVIRKDNQQPTGNR